jgi:hypothetical protein
MGVEVTSDGGNSAERYGSAAKAPYAKKRRNSDKTSPGCPSGKTWPRGKAAAGSILYPQW